MIIYGTNSYRSTLETGVFVCPCCKTESDYQLIGMNRWFTLYFIPVIPLGKIGQFVECRRCSNTYADTVLAQSPMQAEVINAEVVETHPVFGAPGVVATNPFASTAPVKMTTSGLAIASLVLGILVPFTVCVQPLWMGCALGSIICALLASREIQREPKKVGGIGIAIAGLLLSFGFGGLFLFVTVLMMYAPSKPVNAPGTSPRQVASPQLNGAQAKLDAAERAISSNSQGNAHGNTPAAKALAAQFSSHIKALRDELFTKKQSMLSMSGGEFITYCELQPNRCAFIVHVPSYRKFSSEAKQSLAQLAWMVGQETVSDSMQPGDSLGIGLKGIALYGSVMVGNVGDEDTPNTENTNSAALLSFFGNFSPKPVNQPAEPDTEPMPNKPQADEAPSNETSPSESKPTDSKQDDAPPNSTANPQSNDEPSVPMK